MLLEWFYYDWLASLSSWFDWYIYQEVSSFLYLLIKSSYYMTIANLSGVLMSWIYNRSMSIYLYPKLYLYRWILLTLSELDFNQSVINTIPNTNADIAIHSKPGLNIIDENLLQLTTLCPSNPFGSLLT